MSPEGKLLLKTIVRLSRRCQTLSTSPYFEDAEINPIQYDSEIPFKHNNFVYRISLPPPVTSDQATNDEPRQPGRVAVPDGTKELILRLTNSDAGGMKQKFRVENEVAMITLASAALAGFEPHVVPSVYA